LKPIAPLIAVVGAAFAAATVGPALFAGALALITSPITLIIAGVAGILWAVNDLVKAFKGGESVIADFFQEFLGFDIQPVLKMIVSGFKNAFKFVTDLVSDLFGNFMSIFSGIGKILSGDFLEGFKEIGEGLMGIVGTLSDAFFALFGDLFKWIGQKILGLLPDWIVEWIGGDSDKKTDIKESRRAGGETTEEISGGMPGTPWLSSPQAFQPGGSVSNVTQSSRVDQTVNMEIRTSDPERAGKAAADNLQRQMDDARTQSRRGGM
jgi:hypothetical protein